MGNGPGCAGCKLKEAEVEAPGEETPLQTISFHERAKNEGSIHARAELAAVGDAPVAAHASGQRSEWTLPPGGQMTIMMFGMTGAGKSALGNLIAGFNAFESGDDTASVTNLDSVMRYEAEDGSLVLLDTIGLGDTEIDQTKVVASIRDVALSAPNGIDVLLFVMRNVRITDDAIARLIYATEHLWGSECLLNLYIVVTCASRYLNSKEEALAWIDRQVEINWRFKHIYKIVGENPNRFVFVDNPDANSGEPNWKERQLASREALMRTLALHPRDAVPPFRIKMMQRVQELAGKSNEEDPKQVEAQGKKSQQKKSPKKKPRSSTGTLKRSTTTDTLATEFEVKMSQLATAKIMTHILAEARADAGLQAEAARDVEVATLRFYQRYEHLAPRAGAEADAGAGMGATRVPAEAVPDGLRQACKRMATTLLARRSSTKSADGLASGSRTSSISARVAADAETEKESNERALNDILVHVRGVLESSPAETFHRLDKMGVGAISPLDFTKFLRATKPGIRHHHVGGLWRRADLNCDGQLDLKEFCTLLRPPTA
mmetsp:Transcript_96462/g.268048  ORF Transcript_96462/g.268048 Transcript_96462/m.268048 type:complete len:548 (+) Transcript_96462:107-1750(+)